MTALLISSIGWADRLDYATILLDTTGSMNTLRADGSTRCDLAFQMTEDSIYEFFDDDGGQGLNIYTFGVSGNLVSITNGFTDKINALNKMAEIPRVCNQSSTALAEAICVGSDELRSYGNSKGSSYLTLFVMTDGKELSSQVCGGRDAIESSNYISKQWHQSVWNNIMNEPVLPVAARIFWPSASEIPDDFEFLKVLSITSGSIRGGASGSSIQSKPSAETRSYYPPIIIPDSVINTKSISR